MSSPPRGALTVLGAGVIGLTSAIELSRHYDVRVVASQIGPATDSRKATAVWHVYLVTESELTTSDPHLVWAEKTLLRLIRVAQEMPDAGLEIIEGTELFRTAKPALDQCWMPLARRHLGLTDLDQQEIDAFNDYDRAALPPAVRSLMKAHPVLWGYKLNAPAASMPVYLAWLQREAERAGVTFEQRSVSAFSDVQDPGICLINCSGFGARELASDAAFVPYKGQYFVLQADDGAPSAYIGDDDNPAGMSYSIPRAGEVLVGGTAERGCDSLSPDVRWDDVRARAGLYVPWVAEHAGAVGDPVVGIRPVRATGVRLEVDSNSAGFPIVHNYGHGGSGFSLSWGCAERVAELVSMIVGDRSSI